MGVFTCENEHVSIKPPARLFKALILDSRNLIHKTMPQAIKSIDIIQRKQINFIEGSQLSGMKNCLDKLNEETFMHKYTMINLNKKLESIVYEVKFEPTLKEGSKNGMKSTYYTKGDAELKEEYVKEGSGYVQGRRSVHPPKP